MQRSENNASEAKGMFYLFLGEAYVPCSHQEVFTCPNLSVQVWRIPLFERFFEMFSLQARHTTNKNLVLSNLPSHSAVKSSHSEDNAGHKLSHGSQITK